MRVIDEFLSKLVVKCLRDSIPSCLSHGTGSYHWEKDASIGEKNYLQKDVDLICKKTLIFRTISGLIEIEGQIVDSSG
jgi:hypothetical protein